MLTEHQKRWPEEALEGIPGDLLVFNEREYDYHQGHIIVLGAGELRPWKTVPQLREQVLEAGGLMILAHPFRFYPSGLSLLYPMNENWHEPGEWPAERLAGHSLFGLVDAVEAWNYRATPAQNELAEACARVRSLPIIAGSDSHAPEDIGHYATEFDDDIGSLAELLAAIRAGRCRPVELTDSGTYEPPLRTSGVLLERN